MGGSPLVLAADVGGTNSRFALVRFSGGRAERAWRRDWPSRGRGSLTEIAREAAREVGAAGLGSFSAATLAVAGPVEDGRSVATNLPWTIDARELAAELGLPRVGLLNDLEANAWGLDLLGPGELATLLPGDGSPVGNRALVSAGTGLGVAGAQWDGDRHRPFASEGGHASFSPCGALQAELCAFLAEELGHVSWERVLSGPGLVNVYRFLRDTGRGAEPRELAAAVEREGGAAVSRAALAGGSPLAEAALLLFAELYGSMCGNAALTFLARGGVFLGGGIAPKILAFLQRPAFAEAFLGKGRLRGLLGEVPVRVVLEPDTALLGAARHAALSARPGAAVR